MVDAMLDPDGHVTEAQVSSGPAGLRGAVIENVLQSRYQPGAARVNVSVNFLTYRIGGTAALKKLKSKDPEYPDAARADRVQGTVRLDFTVAVDGTVKDVQVVSGDPRLTQAAVDAVQQWVYAPVRLNGVPAEVMAGTSVNFTLPDAPN
jgi:TonB family protein